MDKSFLGVGKVSEYFGGTTAYVEGNLVYIRNINIEDAGKGKFNFLVECRAGEHETSELIKFTAHDYDEAMEHIKPYLPKTQYLLDHKGRAWLCAYSPVQTWKRSLSSPRYKTLIPNIGHRPVADGVKRYPSSHNPVKPRLLAEVLEDLESEEITPMSSEFALYEGASSKLPLILYGAYPVACVNKLGLIVPHPKYYNFFKGKLSELGDVVDENS